MTMNCFKNRTLALVVFSSLTLILGGCATGAPEKKEPTAEERATLYIQAASATLKDGDPTGALQYLKMAEELKPSMPEIYQIRAIAFHTKHDLPSALREIKRAVALRPDGVEINNTYGKLLIDSGDYRAAEPPLLKAISDPTYRDAFKAYTNLGILHYRLDEMPKAVEYFDHAILESPLAACIAYFYKGHIEMKLGHFKTATQNYDHATQKFCAGFADGHLALGIAYERNKQYDLARKKFLDVKQNFPNSKVAEQAMDRLHYLP